MNGPAIIDWAGQTGLAITALVVLILIIRKPFARHFGAGAAYALWALPLFRLFMPPVDIPILRPDMSLPTPEVTYRGVDVLPIIAEAAASKPSVDFGLFALVFWLGGGLLWLVYQLIRQRASLKYLRVNSGQISDQCADAVKDISRKINLKRIPDVRLSKTNTGPLVTGIFRPLIILPHDFETHFTPQQQSFALMHELSHIKRRDLWAAYVALLFRAVNWPNPLIHYGARKFRADQEAACDASVLRHVGRNPINRQFYAETLLHSARQVNHPGAPSPLGLTIYHPLKERLMMMTSTSKKSNLLSRVAATALLIGAAVITAPLTAVAGPDKAASEKKNESRQVIKSIKDVDGVKTKTHYEIVTKDGETTAYSIDANGIKTKVDPKTIKTKHMKHGQHSSHVFAQGGDDVEAIIVTEDDLGGAKKRIKIVTSDGDQVDIDKLIGERGHGQHAVIIKSIESGDVDKLIGERGHGKRVVVKTVKDGDESGHVQVYSFDSETEIDMDFEGAGHHKWSQGAHAKAMVTAANGLLQDVDTKDLSSKAKRKLEKAQKALAEAEAAIEAEK